MVPGSAAGIGRICTKIQGGEFSPALWIELSVLRFGRQFWCLYPLCMLRGDS
jgi:hypothetical protein